MTGENKRTMIIVGALTMFILLMLIPAIAYSEESGAEAMMPLFDEKKMAESSSPIVVLNNMKMSYFRSVAMKDMKSGKHVACLILFRLKRKGDIKGLLVLEVQTGTPYCPPMGTDT